MWSCRAGLAGSRRGNRVRTPGVSFVCELVSMQNSGKFMSLQTVKCKDNVDLLRSSYMFEQKCKLSSKESFIYTLFDLFLIYLIHMKNICIYACMIAWIPGEEQLKSCEKHQLKAVNNTMRQGVLLGNLPPCRPGVLGRSFKGSSSWRKQGKGRTFSDFKEAKQQYAMEFLYSGIKNTFVWCLCLPINFLGCTSKH